MSGYNGWSNYETWNFVLWIDNEQGSQEYWIERAQSALDDAEGNKEEAADVLSKELEADADENMPEASGFYGDVLRAAVGAVDWHEAAKHFLADLTYESNDDAE